MDDDDGPPMLVDSNGVDVDDKDANLNAETEDAKPTKVPISIITGELGILVLRSFYSYEPAYPLHAKQYIRSWRDQIGGRPNVFSQTTTTKSPNAHNTNVTNKLPRKSGIL
jgi:hypothetical protein